MKKKKGRENMKTSIKRMVCMLLILVLTVLSMTDPTNQSKVYAAENDSITIHFKSTWGGANIFFWNQGEKYNNPVKWPGVSMTDQGDEWYTYTFENTDSVDFMFNYGGKQTTYYTKTTGEYWFQNNQWYDKHPEGSEVTPTSVPLTSTPVPSKVPTEAVTAAPTATQKPTVTQEPTATPKPQLQPTRAVTPTAAPKVTIAPSEKTITLHFKSDDDARVYYWDVNNGTNTPVAWPGVSMEDEGNGWYVYTIENAQSTNLVFTTQKGESEEIFALDGEWWYADEMCDFAPDDYVTGNPTITSEPILTEKPTATPMPEEITPTGVLTATPVVEPTSEGTLTPTAAVTNEPTQKPSKTPTPTPSVRGKIIVHFTNQWEAAPYIYCWSLNGVEKDKLAEWPGTEMTSEGNGRYTFTIDDVTKAKIIFNNKGEGQTGNLTRTEGEWWYENGKWYSVDPIFVTPEPTPTRKPRPTRGPTATPVPIERTDFRDETIYFLMTTRFYDGDPSNNVHCWEDAKAGNPDSDPAWRGDFKGIIEQLDYIKALGFTAIWISSVVENTSGYDYHGYHPSNFDKVDPRYESEGATYEDLIEAVHAKGMKIIQDVVLQHTGNFGEAYLIPMFEKTGDLGSVDCLQVSEGSVLPEDYEELSPDEQYQARLALMKNVDGQNHDTENLYHHYDNFGWDEFNSQVAQIAGDCVDLNTENPIVYNYLIDCYTKYINMGVDAFRVDTAKHISRLTLNKTFNKAFKEAGGENFFMFAEVCARAREVWYRNTPPLSAPFYTWAETKDYPWSDDPADIGETTGDGGKNEHFEGNVLLTKQHYDDNNDVSIQPTSDNAFLDGNEYHEPDYSQFSGLNVIDFPMHWNFKYAQDAYNVAVGGDKYYNDATWNVTYVDSHDYAPDGAPDSKRFTGSQDTWAENLNLMFTFRGIPCIYYGSEIEFMKGAPIDVGTEDPLSTTGRAYFGDNLEGEVTTTDFGEYTASGVVADTLSYPLSLHIQRLNKIRAAVPALRKGQYSTEDVDGNMAFKRRYTNTAEGVDSFVCVSITDEATFTGIPNGHYVDAVTGNEKNVTDGTLTIEATEKGNMRVYVLDTDLTKAPGKVGADGKYLK